MFMYINCEVLYEFKERQFNAIIHKIAIIYFFIQNSMSFIDVYKNTDFLNDIIY